MAYTMETSRLYLEPLTVEKHLEGFHLLWSNEKNTPPGTTTPTKSLEESSNFMGFILPNAKNPEIDKFAVLLKTSRSSDASKGDEGGEPKMIGFIGTNRWCDYPSSQEGVKEEAKEKAMEVGFCFDLAYWRQGYATEALSAFLEWFWKQDKRKNIKRLVGKTISTNEASQRLLVKCGAVKGEVIEDGFVKMFGVKGDACCYVFDRPAEL